MNIKSLTKIAAAMAMASVAMFATTAHAVAYTDTVDAPTGFFIPAGPAPTTSPYYRGIGQDWGWTHNAIAGSFTSRTLGVSAYDVDASSGEVDNIYAMDDGTWTLLGSLAGANNVYSFTNFTLGSNFDNDINAGLQVKIEISVGLGQPGWLVTLAKSSLSVDGGDLPDPNPTNPVPEPETYAMMLAGLGLLGFTARRRKQKNPA